MLARISNVDSVNAGFMMPADDSAVYNSTADLDVPYLSNFTVDLLLPLVNSTNSTLEETRGANLPPHYTKTQAIAIGLVLSIMTLFSIAGNTLVIVALLTDRKLRKPGNYYIVSLAVADALVAITVQSFAVANDILGYWIFGPVFCNVWLSSDVMCSTASILNLCAISLDRYIHIRSPLHYEQWITAKTALLAIAGLWLLSALISFLPIHLGWHRLDGYTPADSYTPDGKFICLLELNPLYAVVSSLVSFYIPCIVMICIYVKLYQYARMHVKNIKKSMAVGAPLTGGDNKNSYKLTDHKAAITLGVIMGTFLFCWVPFFTINIVGAFCTTCIPVMVFSIFTWLGYLNSCMNPIIYSIFNTEFRNAFKRVLSFARCPECQCSCRRSKFEFRKPIRSNGASPNIEYGSVSAHKSNRQGLVKEQITCV